MGNQRMSPRWIERVTADACQGCEHREPSCLRMGEAVYNNISHRYECPANLTAEQQAAWDLRDERREQRGRWNTGSRSKRTPLGTGEQRMLAQVAAAYWLKGKCADELCEKGGPLNGLMTAATCYEAIITLLDLGKCPRCSILTPKGWKGWCQYCQEEAAGIFQILHEVSGFGEYSGDVPRPEPFYGMPGSEPE